MASLAPCLLKLSAQVDAQELRQAVSAYRERGRDEDAANLAAVSDKIKELDAQERRIVEAVRAAWEKDGGRPAESVAEREPPVREPQEALRSVGATQGAAVEDIIREEAKADPFGAFKAVRDKALKRVDAETGKPWGDHPGTRGSMMRDPLADAIHDGQYQGLRAYAASLPVHISEGAIPRSAANAAFAGTSMSPERRGASVQRGYVRDMVDLWRRFEARYNAAAPDVQAQFVEAFNEVAQRYAGLTNAYLASHSRVMSPMIAGPSNFPVRRNAKKSEAADKRAAEANEYLPKARKRLDRVLRGAVDNSLQAALTEAQSKLADREAAQARMKAVNVAHGRFVKDPASLDKADLTDHEKKLIREYKPRYSWEPHPYAPFELTNNNAQIKRMRERVEELQRRIADAEASQEVEPEQDAEATPSPVRMVKDAQANRLQLFFAGKPSEDIRTELKAAGFRWAPSVGAWQRQLTDNAIVAAERVMRKLKDAGEAFQKLASEGDTTAVREGETLGKATDAPWYYSQLARAFEQAKQGAMPGAQWKAWLAANKAKLGVKDDEITWTGINEFLTLQKGKVTREQIGEYLGANGVRVEDVVAGMSGLTPEQRERWIDLGRRSDTLTEEELDEYYTLGGIDSVSGQAGATKFAQWQLPGGKDYRELLLTLPEAPFVHVELPSFDEWKADRVASGEETAEHNWRQLYRGEMSMLSKQRERPSFRSKHFDQPNILAHVRFNERRDTDGKRVLFVEEIQSDWGQKGKKEGFGALTPQKQRLLDEFESLSRIRPVERSEQQRARLDAIRGEAVSLRGNRSGIPAGPFVTDTKAWVSLVLKRMIAHAAENGYDAISWTTGEQQVERYRDSLRKAVDRIEWTKEADGVRLVGTKDGRQVVDTKEAENAVSDAIGKSMADQIRNDPNQSGVLEGDDITISDTGMAGFYDQIVPSVANDLLRKFGGSKVGDVWLSDKTGLANDSAAHAGAIGAAPQPGFTLTPTLRERALGGLPLFAARQAAPSSKLDTLLWSMANRGATSRELLDAIVQHSERAGNRRIAALIRAMGVNPKMDVGAKEEDLNIEGAEGNRGRYVAAYSEATDTVYLLKPGATEADLLHEFVHAATSAAINANTKTAKQMKLLFERVKKVADFDAYGFRKVKEFVAEGLSNPEFQAALDKIPAQRGKIRTLWQWFKDIIRQALGGTPQDMSALDQVLDLGERLIEEDARTAGRVEDVVMGSVEGPKVQRAVTDSVAKITRHDNAFNWLRTRFGSQPGKADMSPPFRRVYEAVESYVQDAAGMAIRAQEMMPGLMPMRDEWRDAFKTNASQADQQAVSRALYAGTFWGGPSPMDGRVFTREELLSGHTEGKSEVKAMEKGPAAIFALRQSKIQGQEFEVVAHPTQAGKFAVAKKGSEPTAMKGAKLSFEPLTERQADFYFQARAAIDSTVTEIGKAAMWRASRAMTGFTRDDMEGYSLEDAQQRILDVLDSRLEDLAIELELLTDKDRINDMAADLSDMDEDAAAFRAEQEREAERVQREIDAVEAVKKSVEDIGGDAQALIDHGYMPAMRFGPHTVTVIVEGKDGKPKTELFVGFEFRYQANRAAKELSQRYAGVKGAQVIVGGIPQMSHTMYEGTSIDGLERLAAHIQIPNDSSTPGTHALSEDAVVQEWIASATATRSALRHHLHRKGIPGYSTDLERVLGKFLPAGARLASSTYHMTEAAEAWEAINKQDADVRDEAAKLIRHVTDPTEKAGLVKQLMFHTFIAIEPIRFIVNRTQPITVGIPWFMQHTSGKHAVELLTAKEPTDDAYKEAKQKAKELGITAPQEMHLLMAMGRGNALVSALPTRVQATIPSWLRTGMHNLNLLAGAFQQISEQHNREQVFKAAWLLAKERPELGDPFKFAKKANDGINFVYGQHAIPDWARPYLGQLVFTYTQWPIQFTELAIKFAKEKHWKALAALLFMVWVMAGAEGEPFAENAEDLIDAIGQASGHATNTKAWLRDKLTSVAGPVFAEAMLRGPLSVLTGIDWSGRFSLGKIIPGTRALVRGEQEDRGREILRILGPGGTLADNTIKAVFDDMLGGNAERGLERIAPKGVQSIVKGAEMIKTGEYRDIRGRKIGDATTLEGVFKMLGGHPESIGSARRVQKESQSTQRLFELRRGEIMEAMATAMRAEDDKGMEEAEKELADWNAKNPELPMVIRRRDVAKKAKSMSMTAEQRMLKQAPRSIRGTIQERLQEQAP